jgi:hypothetical protein
MIDPALHIILATALAMLLANAGVHKLRNRVRFTAQLGAYRLLPTALVAPIARLLGPLELALAVALLAPATRAAAGFASTLLLLGYALAMGINLARGRADIDCGCGDVPQPLSSGLLIRNGVLAVAALILALPAGSRPLVWADLALGLPALLTLAICYLTVDQLLANAVHGRPRRQIDE